MRKLLKLAFFDRFLQRFGVDGIAERRRQQIAGKIDGKMQELLQLTFFHRFFQRFGLPGDPVHSRAPSTADP